jgi:hypothetical protein
MADDVIWEIMLEWVESFQVTPQWVTLFQVTPFRVTRL